MRTGTIKIIQNMLYGNLSVVKYSPDEICLVSHNNIYLGDIMIYMNRRTTTQLEQSLKVLERSKLIKPVGYSFKLSANNTLIMYQLTNIGLHAYEMYMNNDCICILGEDSLEQLIIALNEFCNIAE